LHLKTRRRSRELTAAAGSSPHQRTPSSSYQKIRRCIGGLEAAPEGPSPVLIAAQKRAHQEVAATPESSLSHYRANCHIKWLVTAQEGSSPAAPESLSPQQIIVTRELASAAPEGPAPESLPSRKRARRRARELIATPESSLPHQRARRRTRARRHMRARRCTRGLFTDQHKRAHR